MINSTLFEACTVKPAHAVTSFKQSPVLKGHYFLVDLVQIEVFLLILEALLHLQLPVKSTESKC
jgi:hypothetical protein